LSINYIENIPFVQFLINSEESAAFSVEIEREFGENDYI